MKRAAMSVGGSEHLGLPESYPQLQTVDVYLGWLGRWTRPVRVVSTLMAPFTRSDKARAKLAKRAEKLPGADREPDTTLAPGAHGPVAAWGLDALLHGAAAAGLEDVTDRAQST